MPNILDSYLISLGAMVDTNSFRKFDVAVTGSERSVTSFAQNTAVTFVKMDAVIAASLAAVGLGIISVADKTAQADQQYRLFGMRMLMTKENARAMQQSLDALGATLDEVTYDPELNKRFHELYNFSMEVGKGLGPGFEKSMIGIRDIRMEYSKFKILLDTLQMGVISSLFEKLGFGTGDFANKLFNLNKWIKENLPHWADVISDHIIPVWKEALIVVEDFGGVIKSAAGSFSYLTGVLTGDESIKDTEFSMENLGKATKDWIDVFAEGALGIQVIMKAVIHEINSAADHFGALKAFMKGDFKERDRLRDKANEEDDKGTRDIKDFFSGEGAVNDNPDFAGIRKFMKEQYNYEHGIVENRHKPTKKDEEEEKPLVQGPVGLYDPETETGPQSAIPRVGAPSNPLMDLAPNVENGNLIPTEKTPEYDQPKTTRHPKHKEIDSKHVAHGDTPWLTGQKRLDKRLTPELVKEITDAANRHGIDPNLFAALIRKESQFDPHATSPVGAKGLAQLMPDTAEDLKVKHPYDPEESLEGGAKYLSDLLKRYHGDTKLALAAYNAGMGRVDKHHRIPKIKETQDYVDKIMQYYAENQANSGRGGDVNISQVTINVPHALPEDKWSDFVKESIRDSTTAANRNLTAATAGGAYH